MGKYRYLAKNIGLLTISSFGTKLLSFFFVPLYTNILTTNEYGTYDLFNTTIGLLIPILTLNILESVLRFSIDGNMDRGAVFTTGMRYLVRSTFIVLSFLIINHVLVLVEVIDRYAPYFMMMFLVQAMSGIVIYFARGLDLFADISFSSVLCSFVMITSNILFLVCFKWGMRGYCLANIVGPMVQNIYLLIRMKFWNYIIVNDTIECERKEMLSYCKPTIVNSMAWWVNSVADRYIVTWMCGVSENGVYSVASKIPSILNIFQTIFNQAWTLSAVKDYDAEDRSGFFTAMYNSYNCMMVVTCSGLIVVGRFMAKFLYAKDFYFAWRYVPFLLIAILFGALSGYIDGIFLAVKDSKILAKSTVCGALTNVGLNLILVPNIGALGAAIATAVCYWVVWSVRILQVKKYIKLDVRFVRDFLVYGLLVMQSAAFLACLKETVELYLFEIGIFLLIVMLFRREIGMVIGKAKGVIKSRNIVI